MDAWNLEYILVSFQDGLFSRAMLVSGSVMTDNHGRFVEFSEFRRQDLTSMEVEVQDFPSLSEC